MRLLHLAVVPVPGRYPGIVRKTADEQAAAAAAGVDLDFRLLSPRWRELPDAIAAPLAGCPRLRHRGIGRSLDLETVDGVILRYQGALDPSWPGFLRRHGCRIVTEHHGKEPHEIEALGGVGSWMKARLEACLGQSYLARVQGLIGVTEEIRAYQSARAPGIPSAVISNGISTARIPHRTPPPFTGDHLELGFVAAGFWPWQGLDRILLGLARHRGAPRISLHVVGDILDHRDRAALAAATANPAVEIRTHGLLAPEAIAELGLRWHGALGTLALHRKGLRSACALKVREYAARGLPFAIAHADPDVPEGTPGVLHLAADDQPIPAEALVAFAQRLAGEGIIEVSARLRTHAETTMDWTAKVRAMHAFASAALGRAISPACG